MWWGKTQPAAFWHHLQDFRGNWKSDFLLVFHFCLSCRGAAQEIASDLKDAPQQSHPGIALSNKQQIQRIMGEGGLVIFNHFGPIFHRHTPHIDENLHPLKFHHNATELHLLQNVSINFTQEAAICWEVSLQYTLQKGISLDQPFQRRFFPLRLQFCSAVALVNLRKPPYHAFLQQHTCHFQFVS